MPFVQQHPWQRQRSHSQEQRGPTSIPKRSAVGTLVTRGSLGTYVNPSELASKSLPSLETLIQL